ncbi:MAG: TetR/AcrR family transcriptional regulator [Mycobacterium sp.]
MVARVDATAPARGTRPRNRRALILSAAADLFYRHGYEHVSTGDLAEAVQIGPSALYRHFPSKQQLLAAVIFDGVARVREFMSDMAMSDADAVFRRLSAMALDQRHLGTLWDRESRSMTVEDRHELRSQINTVVQRLIEIVETARPDLNAASTDLLARSLLAVFASPSFHRLDMPRQAYEALLVELAQRVLSAEIGTFTGVITSPPSKPLMPALRREAILSQATRLFATNGYAGVSIEDIGAALGTTGSNVYNHFSSKLEILTTALNRGTSYLMLDFSEILTTVDDPRLALEQLIDSYLRLATSHHYILDLLITESGQLPDEERHLQRQAQHDYISEWTRLLSMIDPDTDSTESRIRVQTALTIINDTARDPHFVGAAGYAGAMSAIAQQVVLEPLKR